MAGDHGHSPLSWRLIHSSVTQAIIITTIAVTLSLPLLIVIKYHGGPTVPELFCRSV